jgi:hypothetical protein
MFIRENNYANCVGYSFSQCFDSDIEILHKIDSDEEKLHMLKVLVAEYEQALEIVEDEDTLMWPISIELRNIIKEATSLEGLYN